VFGCRARELQGAAIRAARSASIAALCLELTDRGGQHRVALEALISYEGLERT
jgi:hypothetical protein